MKLKLKRIRELFGYAFDLLKSEGLFAMARRALGFFRRRLFGKRARYLPKKKVLQAQRADLADRWENGAALPLVSICVPLYNTPEPFLRQFLASVFDQTSTRWELCLADASDASHAYVGEIVAQRAAFAQKIAPAANRVKYVKVENRGISANTNAAADLATGEYLALADHDDILAPHAIYTLQMAILDSGADFLYSDEALFKKSIRRPMVAHFKPDFAPDYLVCCNYICHLSAFKRSLYFEAGGERSECDGSQDHDLFLRLTDRLDDTQIYHIPQVLYYWRVHGGSTSGGTAAKPYVAKAAKKAIADHLERTGQRGEVRDGLYPSTYKVDYEIEGEPLVSILIPNMDHTDDLEKCLSSVYKKTSWNNFEVIVIENNSKEAATFDYYKKITGPGGYPRCRVVEYKAEGGFNFSAINNFGRKAAKGDYLLLLNNDVEVINRGWLTELLMQASRPGVGLCGAMLYYPDDTIQHAGIITGLGGYAGHSHKYRPRTSGGYMFRAATVQDFSAVTAACMLVRTQVFDALNGLDEGFTVAFNDVDFCLRARRAGWRVVWTPYAQLYHYESKSRGIDEKDKAKKARFAGEQKRLTERFGRENLIRDPYYNPGLTLDREDFSESGDLRHLQNCMPG
ncbi:glycosyltransferase family 2 protein [Candidatus Allofournierella excrementavium]|uniref:glycosyltransferase family 2 protein n=1 Tax=Candidatus Allofournierella excrementavium TaxID=2838591 RepID=UPI003AF83869